MLLFHGTTYHRAVQIRDAGPDPDYIEPGGRECAEGFWACLAFGPFDCSGRPEQYAVGKDRAAVEEGRDEGGPAILIFDVPDDVVELAVDDWFPLSQGFVQFDRGIPLTALRGRWKNLKRRVIAFQDNPDGHA